VLTLYDNPVSSNALKVRFLLAELGLEYERRYVPFARPRPEWLTSFHPLGTIPAIDDGRVRLAESNAILRYMAHRERRYDLYPEDPADRAPVDWALDTWSTEIRPGLYALEMAALFYSDSDDWETGGGPAEDANEEAVARAVPQAVAALERFESFLSGADIVLDRLTIADCAAAPALWRSFRLPLSLERFPKVAHLRGSLSARPSFAAAGPAG
jgi:glutathione S-transferase